jgi:GH25 family lysozyme M1 (1,4-beta-N-acetylmuramidase)
MAKLNGIDISGHQPATIVNDLAKANVDFFIIKATQGTSFVSPHFKKQLEQATKAGKLTGVYHFDNGNADYEGEVDHFIRTLKLTNAFTDSMIVWDWEADALKAGVSRLKKTLTYLQTKVPQPIVLYSSGSPLQTTGAAAWCAEHGVGIWLANYPLGSTKIEGFRQDLKPYFTKPEIIIHQYTSSGILKGYTQLLDLNVFFGSKADWAKWTYADNGNKEAENDSSVSPASPSTPTPGTKSNEVLAAEVIAGLWSTGDTRIKKLTAAGYDATAVQKIVNKMLAKEETKIIKVGSKVKFDYLWTQSVGGNKVKTSLGSGKINKIIKGSDHPYLVGDNLGWLSSKEIK